MARRAEGVGGVKGTEMDKTNRVHRLIELQQYSDVRAFYSITRVIFQQVFQVESCNLHSAVYNSP